jgi:ribokinase
MDRIPTISAIGVLSWDDLYLLDHYPVEGSYTHVRATNSGPGGTTGNIAMTARSLGAAVRLFAKVGADEPGAKLLSSLEAAGVESAGVIADPKPTDRSILLVSAQSAERTILWQQAPHLSRGDRIDIERLFSADVTVVDCIDLDLRRFLVDLPAHTRPAARLIGTLTYLAGVDASDKVDIGLRHDVLIGNDKEYRELLELDGPEDILRTIQRRMPGSNLRIAVMTRGANGASLVTRDSIRDMPASHVDAVDTTGAGDAFAGAFAYGVARRWSWNLVCDWPTLWQGLSSRPWERKLAYRRCRRRLPRPD